MKKAQDDPSIAIGEGQKQEGGYSGNTRQKESPFCYIDGHLSRIAELEPKLQIYKGRVVPRGDIVKDDSGAYAVSSEQGPSASQIPDCDGDAANAASAYTQVKLEDVPRLLKILKSE